MPNKSRHAFGSEKNIDAALSEGLINAFDLLMLDEGKFGWIDKNGEKVILEDKKQVVSVDELPEVGSPETIYVCQNKIYIWGETGYVSPVSEGIDESVIDDKIATAKEDVEGQIKEAMRDADHSFERIKYEIFSKPVGTLIDYFDKEIRVMCPADTVWTKQNVGATGNANMYYMGFRAYAPESAVGFKEGDKGVIVDEMFDFSGDFAGTDEFGRNYSVVWFALANYDESSDSWSYYGELSSAEKYIGWTYVVEWYNADGIVIESDSIRINLSNENCHSVIKPYYLNEVETKLNQLEEKVEEAVTVEVIEF